MTRITEDFDRWSVDVDGYVVERASVGLHAGVELRFQRGDDYLEAAVAKGSSLVLVRPDAPAWRPADDASPVTLVPLLALLGSRVSMLEVWKDGRLTIVLGDGTELAVDPADRFEAWQLLDEEFNVYCGVGKEEPSVFRQPAAT
jgi:hypothetical protein